MMGRSWRKFVRDIYGARQWVSAIMSVMGFLGACYCDRYHFTRKPYFLIPLFLAKVLPVGYSICFLEKTL
jgi:hypothetical protein